MFACACGDSQHLNQVANQHSVVQSSPTARELLPGQTEAGIANIQETIQFFVDAPAQECLQFEMTTWQRAWDIRLFDPADKQVLQLAEQAPGRTVFSHLAVQPGCYRLTLQRKVAQTGKASLSAYQIGLRSLQPVTAAVQERLLAEQAWREAERLRVARTESSSRKALAFYQQALTHWEKSDAPIQAAWAWQTIGEVQLALCEAKQALSAYQNALSVAGASGDPWLESSIRNGLCETFRYLNQANDSQRELQQAIKAQLREPNWVEKGRSSLNLAESAYVKGERAEARQHTQQAVLAYEQADDLNGLGNAHLQQGHLLNDPGNAVADAQAAFSQAKDEFEKADNRHGIALALIAFGHLHASKGEGREAQKFYEQAQPLIAQTGDRVWQASLLLGQGLVAVDMRRPEWAFAKYEEALAIYHQIEDAPNEASTLLTIAKHLLTQGQLDAAAKRFDQAEGVFRQSQDGKLLRVLLRERGRVAAAQGDGFKAQKFYAQALAEFRRQKEWANAVDALVLSGQAFINEKKFALAKQSFERGLALLKTAPNRLQQAELIYGLARVAVAQKRLNAATGYLFQAIELAEKQRQSSNNEALRTSYFANAQDYFELCLDLLVQQGKTREAFDLTERARARGFNEWLQDVGVNPQGQLAARYQQKEKELLAEIRRQAERNNQLAQMSVHDPARQAALRLTQQKSAELAELRAHLRDDRNEEIYRPATLAETQRLLPTDVMLLEYALGVDQCYLWAVTNRDVRFYALGKRAQIEDAARGLWESLRDGKARAHEVPKLARYLSALLIEPMSSSLRQQRLVIVPAGALQLVPFAALPAVAPGNGVTAPDAESASSGAQWMIQRHEINYLPSASSIRLLREQCAKRARPGKQVAVLADGIYEENDLRLTRTRKTGERLAAVGAVHAAQRDSFERLYYAKQEADAIAALERAKPSRVWREFDATLEAALSPELADYRIVHFATHGVISREDPELSSIILSLFNANGQPRPGHLLLSDIYHLRWSADLVVLSACDTALGKDWRGEGVEGISRAFFHAGAARVMASLWKVNDEATAELMKRFYVNHFNHCLPIAAALRQAQLEMLAIPKWNEPRYWSGFILQGEWQ